jgi:hypothetical protein
MIDYDFPLTGGKPQCSRWWNDEQDLNTALAESIKNGDFRMNNCGCTRDEAVCETGKALMAETHRLADIAAKACGGFITDDGRHEAEVGAWRRSLRPYYEHYSK